MRDLSLHLMDILQNSISAQSSIIKISILVDADIDLLIIRISDNGVGMSKELLDQVTNPFTTTRTTRKVGLGIPLFSASALRAGGQLDINSIKGEGTTLSANFKISNIDRVPLGNIAQTIVYTLISSPQIDLELSLENKAEIFEFKSAEIREKIGEIPITEHSIIAWIQELIDEEIKIMFGGVLDEIIC